MLVHFSINPVSCNNKLSNPAGPLRREQDPASNILQTFPIEVVLIDDDAAASLKAHVGCKASFVRAAQEFVQKNPFYQALIEEGFKHANNGGYLFFKDDSSDSSKKLAADIKRSCEEGALRAPTGVRGEHGMYMQCVFDLRGAEASVYILRAIKGLA